jgi:hypothetical protein
MCFLIVMLVFVYAEYHHWLVKMTPGVNFTNILRAAFMVRKYFAQPLLYLQFGFVILWQKDFGAKAAHKMLVKLTPEAVFLVVCDPSMNEL